MNRLTSIEGVHEIILIPHHDERGYFVELLRISNIKELFPKFNVQNLQVNHSYSSKDVIRGLHFSISPQRKIVYCLEGVIQDCILDLRPNSKTYLSHVLVTLSADSKRAIYIDEGLAHGFEVISDSALVVYMVDSHFDPEKEREIDALDKDLGIEWHSINAIRSKKDKDAPSFSEYSRSIKHDGLKNGD